MRWQWFVAGTLVLTLALAGTAMAWDKRLRSQVQATYGPSPSLGISFVESSEGRCQEIVVVHPVVHYTWFGRIWQDESLDWADVQIQHPPPQEFRHDHSGPVKVGDVVCGFGEVSDIRYVHRPTGIVLTETCESYRCPLE